MRELIEKNPWISTILTALVAGLGIGGIQETRVDAAAGIWEGQYEEARMDLETCRDTMDDLRDTFRDCREDLIECDRLAGHHYYRAPAMEAEPDVAAPPPE